LKGFYYSKKVLITGHTGFKGTWLCSWLISMGAEVYGYSTFTHTNPLMYELTKMKSHVRSIEGNILDSDLLFKTIHEIKPDIIFHLAAQPIASLGFQIPLETFQANMLGMVSVLDAVRKSDHTCSLISITSDTSYLLAKGKQGKMEVYDPYSASKTGAEIIFNSYYHSFFRHNPSKRVAIARAGNVIGGGDWGVNRIVPDCMKAWINNELVPIRRPSAIHPWLHVMDSLHGYLLLAKKLHTDENLNGQSFNFGPSPKEYKNVLYLVQILSSLMESKGVYSHSHVDESNKFEETEVPQINYEKASNYLGWQPYLNLATSLEFTAEWYFEAVWKNTDPLSLTIKQILNFENKIVTLSR
jgi:CDP-glucose 4,6-dehydratase